MRKLGVEEWLVRMVQVMYKGVKSMVKVGDGCSKEFGVDVDVHQGSVLSPLLFINVIEAVSMGFRIGSPWELLYADDLVIISETLVCLVSRLEKWKNGLKVKELRVNMVKKKVMICGNHLSMLKKSGCFPCGVCFNGVGCNSIFCEGCKSWMHKKC